MIYKYISPKEVTRYQKNGWVVTTLPMPHGYYSALAMRPIKAWDMVLGWGKIIANLFEGRGK